MPGESVQRAAKHELRAAALAWRGGLTADEVETARRGVRAAVLARFDAAGRSWRCVAAYRPLRTEPGSVQLLDALAQGGVRVLVPVLRDDRDLDWAEASAPSRRLGVAALASADVVLVPALAVDRHGVRLGRGGGSYDRALARLPAGVPAMALLYDGELVESLPADAWDVRVTGVVTPSGWHELIRQA